MEEAPKIGRSVSSHVSAKETAAMRACVSSLGEIKAALIPFLRVLNEDNEDDESSLSPHKRAEAQAAVALVSILDYACLSSLTCIIEFETIQSLGTLKHMGRRLRGLKQDDSLRKNLDKTRKLIVLLRKEEAGGDRGRRGEHSSTETSKRKEPVGQNDGRSIHNNKKPRR